MSLIGKLHWISSVSERPSGRIARRLSNCWAPGTDDNRELESDTAIDASKLDLLFQPLDKMEVLSVSHRVNTFEEPS
jgi:hypothetical protein